MNDPSDADAARRRPSPSVHIIGAIVVSALVLGAFGAVSVMLFLHTIPTESKDIANVMFGYLGGMATSVVAFWVGSSLSSQRKDATIADIAKGP
jgi:hypothetical protein